jgi:hypothetical protein
MSLEKKTSIFPLNDTPVALTADRIAMARMEATRLRAEAIADAIVWVVRAVESLFARRPDKAKPAVPGGHAAGVR